ncbi:MAG: caspase family protein [Candidatus Eisenbacteria bacterium]
MAESFAHPATRFRGAQANLAPRFLFGMLFLTALVSLGLASRSEAAGTSYALLIGINRYASAEVPPLAGCVADVEATKQILQRRMGFPPNQIKTLTDRQATRKAILAALRNVVASAKSGDNVYIHYSGHGSQVKDLNADENDGLDETLIPHDGRTRGIADITDDTLNKILAGLRTERVLVVLDACHSGTATRSFAVRTRSIQPDVRMDLYAAEGDNTIKTRSVATKAEPRYVVLSATGQGESALDAIIDGKPRGVFSFALTKVLQVAMIVAPPVKLIGEVTGVLTKLQNTVAAIQAPLPTLEGPADLIMTPPFAEGGISVSAGGGVGDSTSGSQPFVEVKLTVPTKVALIGAAILGAKPGSYWAIFKPGEKSQTPTVAVAVVTVDSLRGNDAVGTVDPPSFAPEPGMSAGEVATGPSEPSVTVDLRAAGAPAKDLRSAIQERFPQAVFVGPEDLSDFIVEVADGPGQVSIYGAAGLKRLDQFAWSDAAKVAEQLAPRLRNSFNASELKSLSNPSTRIELAVRVVGEDEDDASKPDYRIRGAQDSRSPSNSLMLAIQSNVDCYLTIVDVDTEGKVSVIFPNEHQQSGFLPDGRLAAGSSIRIPDALAEPNEAGFAWDYGPPAGEDVVQVFATTDLDATKRLRAHLNSFAALAATKKDEAPKSRSVRMDSHPLTALRAEMAGLALTRGIAVVPTGTANAAAAPEAPPSTPTPDWTAVPVTISVAP